MAPNTDRTPEDAIHAMENAPPPVGLEYSSSDTDGSWSSYSDSDSGSYSDSDSGGTLITTHLKRVETTCTHFRFPLPTRGTRSLSAAIPSVTFPLSFPLPLQVAIRFRLRLLHRFLFRHGL